MDSKIIDIRVTPEEIDNPEAVKKHLMAKYGPCDERAFTYRVLKRSIDGRSREPRFSIRAEVCEGKLPEPQALRPFAPISLTEKEVIVVGAGPAGYFAALRLLEMGIRPVVLDRGKDVRSRRFDLKKIYSEGKVDPHSNYCFGEGGAGTYSDGKLYTRSSKRGDVGRVLDLFIDHGASETIRVDAHPHLGSNVLPKIVRAMRENILSAGGEIRFESHVTSFEVDKGLMTGVTLADGQTVKADAVILATGHSARDVYRRLHAQEIRVEAKPFALGLRIEHTQDLIDQIFYRTKTRHPNLPAASYRIACQANGRGVFSFCMCPGGFVVPAATAPGELVLNGMSLSYRSAEYANAGLVAEVRLADIGEDTEANPLAALEFQEAVEQKVFKAGDGTTQKAPAQRVEDFLEKRPSTTLKGSSYLPGLYPADLHELLPPFVAESLAEGLQTFGKKFKGFAHPDATLIAVESRTSSPVRIPREKESFMHPDTPGLFPAGEGAGYAGGIVSAAMDGLNVADAVARWLEEKR
ncbi:NAD(P)/FAD-dependent oxidoreductase [Desulfoluna spongiiphila]|uniref:NAD(P)/FAD-dependent oxidoreductase n=1 Tax=Desulfoluna spongiiphila TaxID=419481 RepID=UPI00125402EA|nr:FAD-dependent oxidoreductase [Desulfoluna spongiiphila]VVS94450.1 fad dependent protein [Desulfoluna spongiiphila]